MEKNAQENLVRRYLLGDLPEAEQITLEQEYFANEEKFEQVWALENELVDGYVRNNLSRSERELFERNYLTSPTHRQRVAVAKDLLKAADATLAAARNFVSPAPPAPSWWSNFLALFQMPQLVWGGAVAALLLALGGWWLFRDTASEQVAQVPTVASPTPTAAPPAPQVLPSIVAAQPTPNPSVSATTQPAVSPVLAFVLGGGLRKPGDVQTLSVPNGTKQVRLQLKLEGEAYPSYQIKLRTAGGKEILNQPSLRASADKKSVALTIPAPKLPAGDYILTLSGVTAANETDEITRHFLRVVAK